MRTFTTILAALLMSIGGSVHAATPAVQLQQQPQGDVAVVLAPKGVIVNVIEGTIRIEGDVFIDTSASIVGMWVEAPLLKDGVIRFAGVIPGGFSGMVLPGEGKVGAGQLFLLRSEAGARAAFEGGTAYLHDGVGTSVALVPYKEERIAPNRTVRTDTQPPRITSVEVTDGEYTDTISQVMVTAVDKESGVRDVQLRYGEGAWQSVSMPHSLDPGLAAEGVDVRVFDGAGNYTQQSVASSSPLLVRASGILYPVLGMLGVVVVLLVLLYVRRRI
jgi:hypothetical protein